jgi:hypothetical protein
LYIIDNIKYYVIIIELPAHRAERPDSTTDPRPVPRQEINCLSYAWAGLEWIAKNNGFTALRTGGDHIDGTLGEILKIMEIALGFQRKLFIRGRAGGKAGPSLERLVDRLTVGQHLEISRHVSIERPLIPIAGADLQFLAAIEYIQFRDGQ